MRVRFVSHAGNTLASHRMRVMKPHELLSNVKDIDVDIKDEADMDADVNVFQKHLNQMYDPCMVDMCKRFGVKTVFDISDDHFTKDHKQYYIDMCKAVDLITVNSVNLQEAVKAHVGRDSVLVKDPITFPRYNGKLNLKEPKLLWYGHASNLQGLQNVAPGITDPLHVITNIPVDVDMENITTQLWEPGLVEDVIPQYDVVLLPLSPDKQNKNTNRAVDALHAGRFVIADSKRVYGELEQFIYIGDIVEGIEWVKNNPEEAQAMVRNGQDYVTEKYSDLVVKNQWEEALKGVMK